MAGKIELSVILNAHREASLMQPTLRSVAAALTYAQRRKITTELVIVLDSTDDETRVYLTTWLPRIFTKGKPTIIEVDNHDLGQSRNDGIHRARGEIVAVIDADDIYTESYFVEACERLKSAQGRRTIIHPGYVISFDAWDEVQCPISSDSPRFDRALMAEYNPWPSQAVAYRATYLEVPYADTNTSLGFGPEDWLWNTETLGRGYIHVADPKLALFYRRKRIGSLAKAHGRSLLPRTELLSIVPATNRGGHMRLTRQSETAHDSRPVGGWKPRLLDVLRAANNLENRVLTRVVPHGRLRYYAEHMYLERNHLFRPLEQSPESAVEPKESFYPAWLIDEWRRLQRYDDSIYPTRDRVRSPRVYRPVASRYTETYWQLIERMQGVEYVFLCPWLKTGGADLVILNYIRAIKEKEPGARVAVLATEDTDSPWRELLPDGVDFIEYAKMLGGRLSGDDAEKLLAQVLVQVAPHTIHIVNSILGYRTMVTYARQVTQHSRLFVSAFSIDRDREGREYSYLYDYLPSFAAYTTRILTDNSAIIGVLTLRFAIDEHRFAVHTQPSIPPRTDDVHLLSSHIRHEGSLQVLWAARFDYAKHLDVLRQIALEAERQGLPVEFHVYGSSVTDGTDMSGFWDQLDNVVYEGPFSRGIWQLPCADFDAFLLTSEWEGMPNALLQAIQCGLPPITPLVGGIADIVNEVTGYPIPRFDDIEAYIATLRNILDNRADLVKKSRAAKHVIDKKYTWSHFVDQVTKEDGYLKGK